MLHLGRIFEFFYVLRLHSHPVFILFQAAAMGLPGRYGGAAAVPVLLPGAGRPDPPAGALLPVRYQPGLPLSA